MSDKSIDFKMDVAQISKAIKRGIVDAFLEIMLIVLFAILFLKIAKDVLP